MCYALNELTSVPIQLLRPQSLSMLVLVYAKRTLGCSHVHRQSSTEVDPDITLGEYLSRCHTSALTRYRPFLLSLVLVWQLNYAEIANEPDSLKSYIGSSICNEYVKGVVCQQY